jgi:hypothetical protein
MQFFLESLLSLYARTNDKTYLAIKDTMQRKYSRFMIISQHSRPEHPPLYNNLSWDTVLEDDIAAPQYQLHPVSPTDSPPSYQLHSSLLASQ